MRFHLSVAPILKLKGSYCYCYGYESFITLQMYLCDLMGRMLLECAKFEKPLVVFCSLSLLMYLRIQFGQVKIYRNWGSCFMFWLLYMRPHSAISYTLSTYLLIKNKKIGSKKNLVKGNASKFVKKYASKEFNFTDSARPNR